MTIMQTPYFTEGQTAPVDPTETEEEERHGTTGAIEEQEHAGQRYYPKPKKPLDSSAASSTGWQKEKSDEKNGGGGGTRDIEEQGHAGQRYYPKPKGSPDHLNADPESTGGQQQEQNGGLSGMRKMLHPAEEALDSARHTAELIMKDAMDALVRTKQRLMEILPSLMPSQAASDASKVVEKVEEDMLAKSEGAVVSDLGADENQRNEKKDSGALAPRASTGITTNSTVGIQRSSPDPQIVRRKRVIAKL